MKPVGNMPPHGALYAIKLEIGAYRDLREMTENQGDVPLPFWMMVSRRQKTLKEGEHLFVFTSDPWFFKKKFGDRCDILNRKDETES